MTNPREDRAEAPLVAAVRSLPKLESYFVRDAGPPLQPRHLLMFLREGAGALLVGRRDSAVHHRHVMIVALRGSGRVGVGARVVPLEAGQVLVIFPFQTHYYLHPLSPDLLWVFVTFEHPASERLDRLRGRGAMPFREAGRGHLLNLARSWRVARTRGDAPLYLALILQGLIRQRAGRERPAAAPPKTDAWMSRVNDAIFARRADTFSVGDLARWIGESTSSLRGKFQQATGTSIGRHIRGIKMSHACELLSTGHWRIGEVAARCGYDSLFAFSRAFRRECGVSPSRYRARRGGRSSG